VARPNRKPIWATGGAIVEPSAGQKTTGWEPGTRPPAQFANWLANYTYQWIEHLDVPRHMTFASGWSDPGATGWTMGATYFVTTSTNGALWLVNLPVRVGDTVQSATFRVRPNGGTNTITCSVAVYSDGTLIDAGGQVSSGGSSWEDVFLDDPINGHVVTSADYVIASVFATGGGAGERRATHLNWITA
jgi:hypothetical protein